MTDRNPARHKGTPAGRYFGTERRERRGAAVAFSVGHSAISSNGGPQGFCRVVTLKLSKEDNKMKRIFSFQSSFIRAMIIVGISLGLVAAQDARAFCMSSDDNVPFEAGGTSLIDSSALQTKTIPDEIKALDSFEKAHTNFREQCATLDHKTQVQRTKVNSTEFDSLQASATRLKKAIPSASNVFRSTITKIKVKGMWTGELDTRVVEQIRRSSDLDSQAQAKVIATLNEAGGARKLLEQAVSQLASLSQEVDGHVNRFRGAVAESRSALAPQIQAVAFSLTPPSLVRFSIWDFLEGAIKVAKVVGCVFFFFC